MVSCMVKYWYAKKKSCILQKFYKSIKIGCDKNLIFRYVKLIRLSTSNQPCKAITGHEYNLLTTPWLYCSRWFCIFFCHSFVNKDYEIENEIIVTEWLKKPDLLPKDDNFDKLLKGFLETPGRLAQPSYNFYVTFSHSTTARILNYWAHDYVHM